MILKAALTLPIRLITILTLVEYLDHPASEEKMVQLRLILVRMERMEVTSLSLNQKERKSRYTMKSMIFK